MKPWQDMDPEARKILGKLAAVALEREHNTYLEDLARKFDEWREGRIDGWELNDAIHRYHQGPSRELFSRSGSLKPDYAVPLAVACGFLKPEEIPPDLREEVMRKAETIMAISRPENPNGRPHTEEARDTDEQGSGRS